MEIVAVPGGEALAAVAAVLFRRVGAPGDQIGLADAVDAAALRHRLARLDHARACATPYFGSTRLVSFDVDDEQLASSRQPHATALSRASLRASGNTPLRYPRHPMPETSP